MHCRVEDSRSQVRAKFCSLVTARAAMPAVYNRKCATFITRTHRSEIETYVFPNVYVYYTNPHVGLRREAYVYLVNVSYYTNL